jgi:hypothetical protein
MKFESRRGIVSPELLWQFLQMHAAINNPQKSDDCTIFTDNGIIITPSHIISNLPTW